MNTVILGGTGFIGSALAQRLTADGFTVTIPSRRPEKHRPDLASPTGSIHLQPWDGVHGHALAQVLEKAQCDVLVNLLGENIGASRWTQHQKERILQSRIRAGSAVTEALGLMRKPPQVLVQASAIGYYGTALPPTDPGHAQEDAPPGKGFLADTTVRWEASTQAVDTLGVRRVVIRTGMVLGAGGALSKFVTPFRFFLGGPLGSGKQEISWVHIKDEVNAIAYLIKNHTLHGAFNITAPESVTMKEFCVLLGHAMNRPCWLRTPSPVLSALLGEMSEELILNGRRVPPSRLQAAGYTFLFPSLQKALADIF